MVIARNVSIKKEIKIVKKNYAIALNESNNWLYCGFDNYKLELKNCVLNNSHIDIDSMNQPYCLVYQVLTKIINILRLISVMSLKPVTDLPFTKAIADKFFNWVQLLP